MSDLALAVTRGLDIETASAEQLRAALRRMQKAAGEGWLDRTYATHVVLNAAQRQIYSVDAERRPRKDEYGNDVKTNSGKTVWEDVPFDEREWAIQGSGYDAINKATGVVIDLDGTPEFEWDGTFPRRVTISVLAVGQTTSGAIRVVPRTVTLHGHHYVMQMVTKASTYWNSAMNARTDTDGFSFGTEAELIEQGKLGKPNQMFQHLMTFDGVRVGYAMDTRQSRARQLMESMNNLAIDLEARAYTKAGRLASGAWHGFKVINPAWLSRDSDGFVIARVPVVGWRSDLTRIQMETVARGVARGVGVVAALRDAGVKDAVVEVPSSRIDDDEGTGTQQAPEDMDGIVPPGYGEEEREEGASHDVMGPEVPGTPAASGSHVPPAGETAKASGERGPGERAAIYGGKLGLSDADQRAAVHVVTGQLSRTTVTEENLGAVKAAMDRIAAEKKAQASAKPLAEAVADIAAARSQARNALKAAAGATDKSVDEILAKLGGPLGLGNYKALSTCDDAAKIASLMTAISDYLGEPPDGAV